MGLELRLPDSGHCCSSQLQKELAELSYCAESNSQLRQEKEAGFLKSIAEPPFSGVNKASFFPSSPPCDLQSGMVAHSLIP